MAKLSKLKAYIFYRYILFEHVGPFFFALSLIIFLFLMSFTLKQAHHLFGRGLDAIVIAKMFYYHLAPTLALAIPMSVLVATVMAFVRIASDNEITILRSAGINLNRIIAPLFFASILVAICVYYFNNTILPQYNIESAKLAREIRRLKPTASIYENTFTDIKQIKLYVKHLDDHFNQNKKEKIRLLGEKIANYPVDHLYDVIIYDQKNQKLAKTIVAKEGFIYLNPEKEIFEIILQNGEIYETDLTDPSQFKHSLFNKTIFLMEANEYFLKEKKEQYKSNRQKTSRELSSDLKKEYQRQDQRIRSLITNFKTYKLDSTSQFNLLYNDFKRSIKRQLNLTQSTQMMIKYSQNDIFDLAGEWHKKYAIPFASIIFLLIGAPLGIMTKRGEAGKAGFLCLFVFVIYYICLLLGEEFSENGEIIPWIGIWSGNFFGLILAALGLFFLRKDQSLTDAINLKRFKFLFKRR